MLSGGNQTDGNTLERFLTPLPILHITFKVNLSLVQNLIPLHDLPLAICIFCRNQQKEATLKNDISRK